MPTFPKVRFILDSKHEAEAAVNFMRSHQSRDKQWFLQSFFRFKLRFLLSPKFSDKERQKIIRAYVADMYDLQKSHFKERAEQVRADWAAVEKKYFALVGKLFRKHAWPKGKYIGFLTIFGIYPRFVPEKTFMLPIDSKIPQFANAVTAHELLHFMFYDYVEKRYGFKEHDDIPGKEQNYLWKTSEAFNSVMEGWKPYQKIFNSAPRPYPETMKIYRKMERQWRKMQDVEKLLDKMFSD